MNLLVVDVRRIVVGRVWSAHVLRIFRLVGAVALYLVGHRIVQLSIVDKEAPQKFGEILEKVLTKLVIF